MSAGAILGGASLGAGVGVSSVALAPFNAANTFLGSSFFGYGMILGERYMYQNDWPKIQARLEHGEQIENIIQEYTGVFTAVVMKEAKIIFDTVTREFINIMREALNPAGSILGGTPQHIPADAPTIGDPRRTPAPQPPPRAPAQTPTQFFEGPTPPPKPTAPAKPTGKIPHPGYNTFIDRWNKQIQALGPKITLNRRAMEEAAKLYANLLKKNPRPVLGTKVFMDGIKKRIKIFQNQMQTLISQLNEINKNKSSFMNIYKAS